MFEIERMLRDRVAALVDAGADHVDEFQEWFVQNLWDESSLPKSTVEFAHEIEHILNEYTGDGHRSWTDVTDALRHALAFPFIFDVNVTVLTGTLYSTTSLAVFTSAAAVVDTPRVEVSA